MDHVRTGALYIGLVSASGVTAADVAGKVYVCEGEGLGGRGSFTITLYEDGTFTYCEGPLSSHVGRGEWMLEKEILTLNDSESDYGFVNRFRVEKDVLIYVAEGSDNFLVPSS